MVETRDAFALSIVITCGAAVGCSFPDYSTELVDEGVLEDLAPETTPAVDSTVDATKDVAPETEVSSDVADVSDADTKDASKPCETYGGTVYLGHCYWISPTLVNEAAAKAYCIAEGAHLVTISTAAENKFVWDLATGLSRWIGLEATTPTMLKTAYKWVNGEPKPFENWASGEPSGFGACVRMVPTSGLWQTRACENTIAVTCERETP